MSHARVIIAIPGNRASEIKEAVEWEMMPFDENGEWFRDGSRWDWYVIGGRSTGAFTGYDPTEDPRNIEVCRLCAGTGKRPRGLEEFGQAWVDSTGGCNGCGGTGKSVKFGYAKYDGDIIQVKDLNLIEMMERRRAGLTRTYEKAAKDRKEHRKFIYDVDPDEIELQDWLKEKTDGVQFPAPYAFLRSRHWHEAERMGWFGTSTATECELKLREQGKGDSVEEMILRCKYKDAETGASVVCWNEAYEVWSREFFHRFIEPLSPDTFLVNVDYHV